MWFHLDSSVTLGPILPHHDLQTTVTTCWTRSSATAEGLCYALLLNLCYVSRGMGVTKVSNSKVTFKVIRGHWKWCHSIGHIRFPISVPLQLCLYLAPLTRYYSNNLRRSRDTSHIPFKGNISRVYCINQHTKFEVCSCTLCKDIIGAKKF